jgi:methylated-DNA-[protein]-cysteine S-methyltransferase
MIFDVFATPIGPLTVAADDAGLRFVLFAMNRHPPAGRDAWRHDAEAAPLRAAREQLLAYFAGDLRAFDLPLAPRGTAFQLKAWRALAAIAYGTTRSYGEQARLVGEPKAVRAIGAANGRNPLPVILPCHRVIGGDGTHTRFGGGLPIKTWLLQHEGALPPQLALS